MDFTLFYIPLLIFFARVCDVTIGTFKIILISKGYKKISASLGFIEVLIWLLAITKIFENLDKPLNYIAYAAGFAAGTYVGMYIEQKIGLGTTMIQVITRKNPDLLVEYLRQNNYSVTKTLGEGLDGSVHIIFSIVNRHNLPQIIYIIRQFNPQAFYTVSDVNYVSAHVGPLKPHMKEKIKNNIKNYKDYGLNEIKRTRCILESTSPLIRNEVKKTNDKLWSAPPLIRTKFLESYKKYRKRN